MNFYEITDNGYMAMLDNPIHNQRIRLELLDHFENCLSVIEQDIDYGDSGSVVSNNQQGTRRSCSFTLVNVDEKYTIDENNFFWFNRKFRLYEGITDGTDTYYFAKGVFITQDADVESSTNSVSINAVDKYGQLDGTLKVLQADEMDVTFEIGSSVEQSVRDILMLDIGNGLVLDPIEPIIDPTIGKRKLYKEYTMSAGSYYGDYLNEIMTSFGCDIFYDNLGRLTVRRVFNDDIAYWYAYKAPAWHFDFTNTGYEKSTLISPSVSSALSGVNKIIVKTDNILTKNASYTAYNNNPRSPLCYSKIGARTLEDNGGVVYISSGDENIDTPEIKCKEYAEYRLLKETCLNLSLDFSCEFLPHLNEGDIVTITDRQSELDCAPFFIQSITNSFDTSEMKISAVNLQYLPTDIYNESNASRSSSSDLNDIVVTYNLNGGIGNTPATQIVNYYGTFTPTFPATVDDIYFKNDYEFAGWGLDTTSKNVKYTTSEKTYSAPMNDTTLYAAWDNVSQYEFKIIFSDISKLGTSTIYPMQLSKGETEYTVLGNTKKYIYQNWCTPYLSSSYYRDIPSGLTATEYIHGFSKQGFETADIGRLIEAELISSVLNYAKNKDTDVSLIFPKKLPTEELTIGKTGTGFEYFRATSITFPDHDLTFIGYTSSQKYFLSSVDGYKNFNFGHNLTLKGYMTMLNNCPDLVTATLGGNLTGIATENGCPYYFFTSSNNLETIDISGNVTITSNQLYMGCWCNKLTDFSIGGNLTIDIPTSVTRGNNDLCCYNDLIENININGNTSLNSVTVGYSSNSNCSMTTNDLMLCNYTQLNLKNLTVNGDCEVKNSSELFIGQSDNLGNIIVSGKFTVTNSGTEKIYANKIQLGSFFCNTGGAFCTNSYDVINNFIVSGDITLSPCNVVLGVSVGNVSIGGTVTLSSNGSNFMNSVTFQDDTIQQFGGFDIHYGSALCSCKHNHSLSFTGDMIVGDSTKSSVSVLVSETFTNNNAEIDIMGNTVWASGSFITSCNGLTTIRFHGSCDFLATSGTCLCGNSSLTDIYFYNDNITYPATNSSLLKGNNSALTIHGIAGGNAEAFATAYGLAFTEIESGDSNE